MGEHSTCDGVLVGVPAQREPRCSTYFVIVVVLHDCVCVRLPALTQIFGIIHSRHLSICGDTGKNLNVKKNNIHIFVFVCHTTITIIIWYFIYCVEDFRLCIQVNTNKYYE